MPNRGSSTRSGNGFRVRSATTADFELLVRHREQMWIDIGSFRPAEIRAAAGRSRTWIRREVHAGRYLGFIAETPAGRVAGSGAIWIHPTQPRPGPQPRAVAPYILSMYTEPEFRRRGVATRLVVEMLEWARRNGYRRVTLHASTEGRPVYLRLGFEPSNEMRIDLGRVRGGSPLGPTRARRRKR